MYTEITDTRIPIKIWAKDLEEMALNQAINITKIPMLISHVALMADAHAGKGSTIGTVIALERAIIPSAVGVDIGCGMCALKLPFKIDVLNSNLKDLRHSFERSIPQGMTGNREVTERVANVYKDFGLPRLFAQANKETKNAAHQLGSLGGGNHFIEVCHDEEGNAWLMLHSGSRHIGLVIAERYIEKAIKLKMVEVPDPALSCLIEGTSEFDDYIHDLKWALNYAWHNRNEMLNRLIKDISHHVYKDARLVSQAESFFRANCHHNFAAEEEHFDKKVWVIRKGAISARTGEWGIIPGSMGTESFIVKGKGNPESFLSSSHGAGRRMSRSKAFREFKEEDVITQTQGIECRKDRGVLDEIPAAYKDINEVMENQKDLTEKVYKLKQILCVKGGKD